MMAPTRTYVEIPIEMQERGKFIKICVSGDLAIFAPSQVIKDGKISHVSLKILYIGYKYFTEIVPAC